MTQDLKGMASTSDVDVAIIGAGIAGLAAAQTVIAGGRSLVVLEARDRAGGRVLNNSTTFAPQPVDIGGQFFHQSANNPLLAEARRQGLPLISDTGARRLYLNGAEAPLVESTVAVGASLALEAAILAAGAATHIGLADVSTFEATSKLHGAPYAYFAAGSVVNGRTGVNLAEPNSSLDYTNFTKFSPLVLAGAGDDIFIPSGMANFLLSTYAKGVPISLNAAVHKICWDDRTQVQLETQQGTVKAKKVIITVPVSLLEAGRPAFDPALPDPYQAAFANIRLGAVDKVLLEFKPNTFPVEPNSFAVQLANTEELTPTCLNMFGANLTLTFVDGDLARHLEREGTEAAVNFTLTELQKMFGTHIRESYTGRHFFSKWATDPWSLGSYSYVRPGHVGARTTLGTPVEDRLFFAGEAVSVPSHGSLNGAYLTGQAAAQAALNALQVEA